ncbi:MAG TPA: serine/threonine-protein kinase [Pyrinomonadaceae bacterium]|nr:serine/threonine-protein kinase [Pyrinomonadaceae bacterium]
MIETGKILQQRYRIEQQIGQGGMGAVYIATDERFASKVAIKETLYMDDSYRKAIEREARLLNSLKHNALPRVSDHFEEENRQFLVMEFIPGEDLGVMMDRDEKPFEVEQVLIWADQLLEALDFLHNQQVPVIHRDIKPQNLKITSRGQIVLLDFGLAKGNPTDAGHQTAAKSIFGYSRNYASLEQIQGTGTDPRSDLYSLAATLYHLLTLVPPEDALTRAMNVLSGGQDPLIPANAIRSEIPAGVAVILQQCLDLNASARPATANEMRQMLVHHEDYANRLHAVAPVTAAGNGDITTHKTKLMPEGTRQGVMRLTDVKTEILPEYISEETTVRPPAAMNGSAKPVRRGRFFRNAAAATLVLAGLAVGGIYLTNPRLFGAQGNPIPVRVVDTIEDPLPEIPAPGISTDSASAMTNSEAAADKQTASQTTEKPTSKSNKNKGQKQSEISVGDVTVDGDTVHVGNMTVRNGRVETPGGYLDENGVWRRVPNPKIQPVTPPTADQWRYMTPEQRRKLRILLRRQNMRPPVPDETPEP